LQTSSPGNSMELSIYKDKLTEVNIDNQIKKLKLAFPALEPGFYLLLKEGLRLYNFTDQRLYDAINNCIYTCIYPTPTIANIIQFDKKIKLFSYREVLEQNDKRIPMSEFIAVRKDEAQKKPYYIEKIYFEQSGLKEWIK